MELAYLVVMIATIIRCPSCPLQLVSGQHCNNRRMNKINNSVQCGHIEGERSIKQCHHVCGAVDYD